jgi:hypothetical protein
MRWGAKGAQQNSHKMSGRGIACCDFAKSIFLVALAFGNGAPRLERGLCPLQFGFVSLALFVSYLPIGLIVVNPR